MKRSTDRILVTHTGSLPRPPALLDALRAGRQLVDPDLAGLIEESVAVTVRRQLEAGVDVINDGETSKESYSTYVRQRLTGFGGESEAVIELADMLDYPNYAQRWATRNGEELGNVLRPPACIGPIEVSDPDAVHTDIRNLKAALEATPEGARPRDVFLSAASPGVIAAFFANHHYPDRLDYLTAIADAMRYEYEAIASAGFVLQLDCPDLAMCRHLQFGALSDGEFVEEARLHVELINRATANIDPDQMRIHLCWGNYEGPHHRDIPLREIIGAVLGARPNGIVLEAANPRHEHEWAVFEEVPLPDGKVIMPGMVDSCTNYIEHPELIAQRLVRYAELVGRENVLAATDCGFATAALLSDVDPDIAWAKLRSIAEGARLASEKLFRKAAA